MRKFLMIALTLSPLSGPVFAADDPETQFTINQYRGWTGIVLRCQTDAANAHISDIVCKSAASEFNYMAENSDIPHAVSPGNEDYTRLVMRSLKLGHPLILQIEVMSTSQGSTPIATHVRMSALKYYSDAVKAGAKPGEPEASPRGGDVDLWDKSTIGVSGDEERLARGMSGYVNDNLRGWFADFLKGWKANKTTQ